MEIKKLFFFDAEWVPVVKDYSELEKKYPLLKDAWDRRCNDRWNVERVREGKDELLPAEYWDNHAFIYPEFNRIICISFGYLSKSGEFKVSSFYDDDEKEILNLFNQLLGSVGNKGFILSGYAIKRYDMPWLAKRMMINGIKPSPMLNVYGKKPWDVQVYDLPEVWGQGCNQESYTPFDWAVVSMGLETPKNDISGAKVKECYYKEGKKGLERIKTYCEQDVLSSYELAKKLIELS